MSDLTLTPVLMLWINMVTEFGTAVYRPAVRKMLATTPESVLTMTAI